jgi:hypothetical protein
MINKKKIFMSILWFLVGMAVAVFPILLFEKCSEDGRRDVREKQGSVDHSIGQQAVCAKLIIIYRTV